MTARPAPGGAGGGGAAAAAEAEGADAFLGVARSLRGFVWSGPSAAEDRLAQAIAQAAGVPDLVARALAQRGVSPAAAAAYLAPALRDLMPDPSRLRDMDRAAARLWQAVERRERVAILADYDVDGAAAAALLVIWLKALGRGATVYVPDRLEEGYGPNEAAMRALGARHDLILCVDCGTLGHAAIAAAGVDVVVLDHHLAGETLPPALAVVNPNRRDEDGALGHLCAAGVVFLLLVAVNRLMRRAGVSPPDLLGLLDLVALATVADVAPLVGLNRAFVRQGLRVMAAGQRPGLAALAEAARLAGPPGVHALGFVFGPRVNAGGRIGPADLGARLLATDDPDEAAALAMRLERLNAERRAVEAAVRAEAEAQAEARGVEGPLVWAAGEGWHPGVVGIVAARLKEAYGRPAVVIGLAGAEGKGSGRSIAAVDLGAAVAALVDAGLLARGGGHRMAAGLTVARERLEPAMERLSALLAAQGAGTGGPRALRIDGVLAPAAACPPLVEALDAAGPFGAASPAPRVALPRVRVVAPRVVGEGHLLLGLAEPGGARLDAIAFRAADDALGRALLAARDAPIHAAGRLEIDAWNGRRRVRLRLDDAALAQ